jgi:hypothetical protein
MTLKEKYLARRYDRAMGRPRPRLSRWIEECCDTYFELVYERWWGGALHPWVMIAVIAMLVRLRVLWWFWWAVGGWMLVFGFFLLARLREQEVIRRVEEQICVECGYDLRASLDRCPECGTPVPMKNLRRLGLWPPQRVSSESAKTIDEWNPEKSGRGNERRSG